MENQFTILCRWLPTTCVLTRGSRHEREAGRAPNGISNRNNLALPAQKDFHHSTFEDERDRKCENKVFVSAS